MTEGIRQDQKKKDWKSKSVSVMIASIVIGALLCAAMFTFLGIFMGKSSVGTIDTVGSIYTKSMGEQIVLRYETVIEQRMTMVEGLRDTVIESDTVSAGVDVKHDLEINARARGFEHLAFYDDEGNMEIITGDEIVITDPEPFNESLLAGQKKAAVATSAKKEGIILIAVPTDADHDYEMNNGKHSIALVAGLSNKVIVDMLTLNTEDDSSAFFSHIIRKDGTYVIRSESEIEGDHDHDFETYFDQIREGFGMDPSDAEKCVRDLTEKMERDERYSEIIKTASTRRHMYCEKLNNSEWYLVTVMDYKQLDSIVGGLSTMWTWLAVGACLVMLIVMAGIFAVYYHLNRQNVQQIKLAREEAISANKAKSEFLSNMSHDIRTPMNAIVGMTAIANSNIDNKQQVQNCLKKIALSSKHLLGLINDVLDMSKIESGKMTLNMEQVSLREVMDGMSTIVQPQVKIKNQHFDVYIYDIITENVYCDSVRLNQILLNLLSNAIKFTSDNGSIEVSLCQEASPRGDDYVRNLIRVKDNGIGMTPEFQAKIFESFTREDTARVHKTEGTGLGMSITKYIVDAMKGTIEVNSEVGKGTEFKITLDLEKAQTQEEEMMLPDWKMLVVDDDEQLCRTTVASLKEIGVRGEWTLSGESAVEKAVKEHDAGNGYNIILMDWKLPGMDGIETARRLRKNLNENIPILLISAYDWSEMENEAREAGVTGFISKPLFKSTLFYGLKHYLGTDNRDKAADVAPVKKQALDGKHILLAEDNDLNWEIADTLLSSAGMIVDRAENGKICVDMLKNSKPGTYDAILMDIRMPVMTGYEATEAIRKLSHADKDLPIIAMTADAFSDDMKKCIDCGMNAHIAKPIDLELVKSVLAKYISK